MSSVPVSFQSGFVGRFLSRIVIGFVVATLLAIFLVARADDAAATRYVIYQNSDASPPDRLIGQPYSHVILSFLTVQYYNNPEFDAPFASRIVGAQTAPLPWSYAGTRHCCRRAGMAFGKDRDRSSGLSRRCREWASATKTGGGGDCLPVAQAVWPRIWRADGVAIFDPDPRSPVLERAFGRRVVRCVVR